MLRESVDRFARKRDGEMGRDEGREWCECGTKQNDPAVEPGQSIWWVVDPPSKIVLCTHQDSNLEPTD